jgi:hypothetical protein
MADGMTEYVVRLLWPHPGLSPNSRLHRIAFAGVKRLAKANASACALADIGLAGRVELRGASALDVTMTFHPPDNRKRDDDNLIASMKAARDGIAATIGVDDGKWRVSYRMAEPVEHGCVLVALAAIGLGVKA